MIRWILRLVLLAILGFGLLIGAVYPWAARNQTGHEIGRIPVAASETAYEAVEVALDPSDEQVQVVVEVVAEAPGDDMAGVPVLEVTVSSDGRTALFTALTLSDAEWRLVSPQSQDRVYRMEAGMLYFIGSEPYVFEFTPVEGAAVIRSVELVLSGGFFDYDASVPPIGWGLIAVGLFGLVISFRRRRENQNSQPPPQRWGRG